MSDALRHLLEAGILIVVLTQIVNLGDLVLSADQKKSIESRLDHLTLLLDYLRPIEWMRRWYRVSRRLRICQLLFLLLTLVSFGVVAWSAATADMRWPERIGFFFVGLAIWGLFWGAVMIVFQKVSLLFLVRLARAEGAFGFLIVFVGFMVSTAVALAVFHMVADYTWSCLEPHISSPILMGAVRTVSDLYIYSLLVGWFLLFVDGAITMLGAALLLLAQIIVAAGRVTMWRIVSYPKGGLAAVAAVLGAVLVVLRVYVGT